MSDPKRHHYVGQFLLEGWYGADGKLCVYARKGSRLVCDRHTPNHTAYEMNLYTIEAFPEGDRQVVEKVVMNKMVDEPASRILNRLLARELDQLDSHDRTVWVRFMFAQWLRTPEGIANVRKLGAEILRANLDANPEEYLAARGDAPECDAYPTVPPAIVAHGHLGLIFSNKGGVDPRRRPLRQVEHAGRTSSRERGSTDFTQGWLGGIASDGLPPRMHRHPFADARLIANEC